MTYLCSKLFSQGILIFPPTFNSMVTMLFNEALQGVSHWFQTLSWLQNLIFSFSWDGCQ